MAEIFPRRGSNPALRSGAFTRAQAATSDEAMTLAGTITKTVVLIALTVLSAGYTWWAMYRPLAFGGAVNVGLMILMGALGGFVVGLVTIFVPRIAPWTSPIYALLEGIALGGISALFNRQYRGLPLEAVGLTFATTIVMLTLYELRIIQATERLKATVISATFAIAILYALDLLVSWFTGAPMPWINSAGAFGIFFSVVVCGIAAFNLIIDFDAIEQGVAHGAPKYMEWYGGFAILVTLVWLYLEILRLLAKLRRR